MTTAGKRSDHITRVRQAVTALLAAYDDLKALRREWDWALGAELVDASGSDPQGEGYAPGDFTGSNAGLMKADIAAVYVTLEALDALMAAGHGTNLQRVEA